MSHQFKSGIGYSPRKNDSIPNEISIRSPPLIKAKIQKTKPSALTPRSRNSLINTPRKDLSKALNFQQHNEIKVNSSPKDDITSTYVNLLGSIFQDEKSNLIYNTTYSNNKNPNIFRKSMEWTNMSPRNQNNSARKNSLSPNKLISPNDKLLNPPFIPKLSKLSQKNESNLSSNTPTKYSLNIASDLSYYKDSPDARRSDRVYNSTFQSRYENLSPRKDLTISNTFKPISPLSKESYNLTTINKNVSDLSEWNTQLSPISKKSPIVRTLKSAPTGNSNLYDSSPKKRPMTSTLKSKSLKSHSVFLNKRTSNDYHISGPVSARFRKTQESIEDEYQKVVDERARKREHMKYVQDLYSHRRKERQRHLNITDDANNEQFLSKEKLQQRLERENDLIEQYREALSKHLGMHNFGWNRFESKKLLEERVEEYEQWEKRNIEEFAELDTDTDGYITHNDLRNNLKYSYSKMHPSEIDELLHFRPDMNVNVTLEEFLYIKLRKEMEIEEYFKEIDLDGDGRINADELQKWLNKQPELFESSAEDIIFDHTNNFSGSMNLKEFKLLNGMGTKQEYASFEKTRELHLQLCDFFYGKHGRTEEEDVEVDDLVNNRDLKKKTFTKKKEKRYPQLFFKSSTRPSNSEIQSLMIETVEDKSSEEEEESSEIIKRLFNRRPVTASATIRKRISLSTPRSKGSKTAR